MTKREVIKELIQAKDLDAEFTIIVRRHVKTTRRYKRVPCHWMGSQNGGLVVETDVIKEAKEGEDYQEQFHKVSP